MKEVHSPQGLRKIIHIDMDAFYASVEFRDNPQYRGKPLAVGGLPDERSVIAAASYEARKFGVKSAMASKIAVQRCPNLIIVYPRMKVYKEISQQMHAIFHRYTDVVEGLAYDEAFLDVTNPKGEHAKKYATQIAREIKKSIKDELQLTASAGISYNKFLAKLASDEKKPNGFCVILPNQALDYVASLPVKRFFGVGPVTAKKMRELHINNGIDLRNYDIQKLIAHFGDKMALHYKNLSNAIDNRKVEVEREIKSISVEHSYTPSVQDKDEAIEKISNLCTLLKERIGNKDVHPYTFILKIKYEDFTQTTRSRTNNKAFYTIQDFYNCALQLLEEKELKPQTIRLLGVGVSHFKDTNKQLSLF